MHDFRRLTDDFWASPQIEVEGVQEASARGFHMIVNNRPDREADDQPDSGAIAAAAAELGLAYVTIPITHAGFSQGQVDAMVSALADADGPVLAFCRSGTRSTLLWSLAQARLGRNPQEIAALALDAGYDVTPVRAIMDMLAGQASD